MADADFFGTVLAAKQIGGYGMAMREYRGHACLPAHTHADAYVTIVIEGGFEEQSEGHSEDCGRNGVVVHAPEDRHVNRFSGGRNRCLSVTGGGFRRSGLLTTPATTAIAWNLYREFRTPDAVSPVAIEALMLELFVASERTSDDGNRAPAWLREARSIVARRFAGAVTLSGVAAAVDVRPEQLARAFRRHFAMSVGDLIRRLRIEDAQRRLATKAPLQEIALETGFADQSHFTRAFRRATGVTPAAYRRTLRKFQGA